MNSSSSSKGGKPSLSERSSLAQPNRLESAKSPLVKETRSKGHNTGSIDNDRIDNNDLEFYEEETKHREVHQYSSQSGKIVSAVKSNTDPMTSGSSSKEGKPSLSERSSLTQQNTPGSAKPPLVKETGKIVSAMKSNADPMTSGNSSKEGKPSLSERSSLTQQNTLGSAKPPLAKETGKIVSAMKSNAGPMTSSNSSKEGKTSLSERSSLTQQNTPGSAKPPLVKETGKIVSAVKSNAGPMTSSNSSKEGKPSLSERSSLTQQNTPGSAKPPLVKETGKIVSAMKSNADPMASGSSSKEGKRSLTERSSWTQQNTLGSAKPALVRPTSVKETRSKGYNIDDDNDSIDNIALEFSEEEAKQIARVISSLRHMELHAGSYFNSSSQQREGSRSSASALARPSSTSAATMYKRKFNDLKASGDNQPMDDELMETISDADLDHAAACRGGNVKTYGTNLQLPASDLERPSSTGAAAKFKGKFHELKVMNPSGTGKKLSINKSLPQVSKQASRDDHPTAMDDEPMDSFDGDLDHAADVDEIENLYICMTERRDSLCGSEFSFDNVNDTIQWKKGNILGKGAFGTVWCGLTSKGELIAVKQIELTIMDQAKAQREYEKIQEEVELLKTLDHVNIVGYLGTSLEDTVVSIFMQFIPGGSLASVLARFGALEESVFRRYTKQILEGVEYLHDNDVIHRDLKGANVMLMATGVIKLIDFGCAKRLCINLNLSHRDILKSMKGSPFWMAPEVINETGHGKKSDIWSIGCTIFEMAMRKPPWSEMNQMAAIFFIGKGDKPVPRLPDTFSQDAIDFVSACLTRDQDRRPSATDMLNHVFITRRNGRNISKAKD